VELRFPTHHFLFQKFFFYLGFGDPGSCSSLAGVAGGSKRISLGRKDWSTIGDSISFRISAEKKKIVNVNMFHIMRSTVGEIAHVKFIKCHSKLYRIFLYVAITANSDYGCFFQNA